MNIRTRTLKALAAASMTAGLLALGAAAAEAHVTVSPNNTTEGSMAQLTFSVPTESETAKTSKLEVQLPTDTPFTEVAVKPLEGWKAEVTTADLPKPVTVNGSTVTKAAVKVTWTAADEAHQIGQDEFQTFTISVATLPKAGTTVILPATQTYTDGTIVKWADAPEAAHSHAASTASASAAAAEGESHPAPAFTTTASGDMVAASATATAQAAPHDHTATTSGTDTTAAATAGWFGLAAGLLGLGAGVLALARTRRKA